MSKVFALVGACLPQLFSELCLHVPSLDLDLYPCMPKVSLVKAPQFSDWEGRDANPKPFVCVEVGMCYLWLWAHEFLQSVECS